MMLSRQRQNMNTPVLTLPERNNIESGSWFSKLSPSLRTAILSRSVVRKLPDGALAVVARPAGRGVDRRRQGRGAGQLGVAVGKQITLTYVEPGRLVRRHCLVDGMPRTHDSNAHGATTLLVVRKPDFKELLSQHVELYDALLRLNCRRLRLMFDTIEDLNTRPLAARLAKQILLLRAPTACSTGKRSASACSSPRKTWRRCSVPRASASIRSSRASSRDARFASNRRAWSCCRKKSCWPSPPNNSLRAAVPAARRCKHINA
jgi:CRP-like cAMP-binding protein